MSQLVERAVLQFFGDHPKVEREALERFVHSYCRGRMGITPNPGHVWAVAKSLVGVKVQGMVQGDVIGVGGPVEKVSQPADDRQGSLFGDET